VIDENITACEETNPITDGSREWKKLTTHMCLTDLKCASEKLTGECCLNYMVNSSDQTIYSFNFQPHSPVRCLGCTRQNRQTHGFR